MGESSDNMESRSRRANAGKRSSNGADALEKLKAARDGRSKRTDQVDVADVADAFEEVDEEEYKAMVKKRRDDNFVDDDGENEAASGYVDYGEEEDWTASHYGEDDIPEQSGDKSSKRKADKGDQGAKRSKAPPKPVVAVSNFFRGGKDINSVSTKKQKNVVAMEADDLLQSMLGDIACETGVAVESAPVLRTKSSQNKAPVASKKPKKFDAFAYSAPPPAAAMMDFDDEPAAPAQAKSAEQAKLDEEIEQLEREQKLSDLKKKRDAMARGEQPEEATMDIGSPGAPGLAPGGSQPSPPSAAPTVPNSNTPAGAQSAEMAGITPKLHKKSMAVDASFWENAEDETQPAGGNTTSGSAKLPERNEDGSIDFYWFDAVEDQYAFPGTVYMFGKVKSDNNSHSSCCVEVKGNLRCMYLLPRKYAVEDPGGDMEVETEHEVTFEDVAKEISQICARNRVNKIQSCRVFREYAFEVAGVPTEKTEYLKVVYPFTSPMLKDIECGQTFSHIFGTNTGCLENFLLRRKLAGPSWLKLHRCADEPTQNSWCQFGAVVTDPKTQISVTKNPPPAPELKVMSVRFRTVPSHGSQGDEIVMASAIIHNQVNIENATESPRFQHFTIVRKLADRPFPHDMASTVKSSKRNIVLCSSEHALLQLFVSKLHRCDPDVIVGHAINSVDIEVLLKRMDAKKTSNWSRLGRLRRSKMPQLKQSMIESVKRQATSGRLVCDTWMTSKELVRQKNYSLAHLAQVVLDTTHQAVDMDDIPNFYRASRELLQLADHCTREAHLVLSLMFKLQVLPLTKQLTNLAGNLWQKSLMSQRAERIEYLLLHEFHNLKYIVPDKAGYKKKATPAGGEDAASANAWRKRKKPAYAGGLVLEPKRGFYDKCVLLLDFNSLYPSIIQEYNICFTTVEYDKQAGELGPDESMTIPEAPPSSAPRGILPRLIKTLVDRRKQVKQLLKTEKNPAKYKQLDIRQLAIKIMANSMYGCLGFTYSRFYAKPLAALVTYKGRDILQNTMDLAQQKLNKEVIYGDTDSIMVYTGTNDLKEVKRIGNEIKAEVNKMYKLLEIEIDGIMQSMLLLNKKKYAALMINENKDGTFTTTKETKGLDLVRRDWCELSQDAGNYVLDQILSGVSQDEVISSIHEHMRTVAAEVRGNKVPLNKYIIHKSLTKPPDAYPDAKGLPHVQVAKQLQKRGEPVTVGMVIQYVICKGEEGVNFAARAYHPDQIMRAEGMLEIDTEWYLSNQIHPPTCRLLSPIDGTDSSQLAECLGLDGSKFRQISTRDDDDDDLNKGVAMEDAERFRECTPLQLSCPHCSVQFEPANVEWNKRLQCPSCNLTLPTCYIQNSLTLAIRNTITAYQDGWMACEEPTCQHRTRQVCLGSYICGGSSLATRSEVGRQCLSVGCRGRVVREITDRKLYLQLLFLQSIFDCRRADSAMDRKSRVKLDDSEHLSPKLRRNNTLGHFDTITEHVKSYLKQSAFNMVSLSNLFNPVMPSNSTLAAK